MMRFLSRSFSNGWFVLGAAADPAAIPIEELSKTLPPDAPVVLVMGSEGRGLRTNVKRVCTHLVKIAGGREREWGGMEEREEAGVGARGRGVQEGDGEEGMGPELSLEEASSLLFEGKSGVEAGTGEGQEEEEEANEEVAATAAAAAGPSEDVTADPDVSNGIQGSGEGVRDEQEIALKAGGDNERRESHEGRGAVQRGMPDLVDSLNVSVATGILLHTLLTRK